MPDDFVEMSAKWLLWGALMSASALGQETPLEVRGEVQYSWIAGRKNGKSIAQNHAGRAWLQIEKGPWELTGAYFFYPLCDFNQFDETTLAFRDKNFRFRAGRFLPKISQSNWYDQWNSGFVFLPDIEHWIYFGELSLWQTSPGAEAEFSLKNATVTLTALDDDGFAHNYLAPRRFDRQAVRIETFQRNWVLGGAIYGNASHAQDGQHLGGFDFRTSGNHWVLRGETLMGNKYDAYYRGFFTDLSVRPPGQDKLTLLARYDTSRFEFGGKVHRQAGITLGAKYDLPQNWVASINFIRGNFRAPMGYQNGFVFGIQKTLVF